MLPISLFSEEGVDVGDNSRNMSYLYGLSDFFSYVFEDTETINVMMEANAVSASEVYSNFLQITSSLTISGIQDRTGASIKLVLVKDSDVIGSTPKYKIDIPIYSAKFLANRPFLPTKLLENEVDFRITQIDSESCFVEFARPLSEYAFSQRPTTDGSKEYAIWATNVNVDSQLMYRYYGKILGVTPEISSEQFSNFVYGLYYLYFNGPTLQIMEQGLNLVLGVPLTRTAGFVLDIRFNVESGKYIIITDTDQYLLPLGIPPSVSIDEFVEVGTPLAKWIELQDFVSGGKWWLDVSIPKSIIRALPGNQPNNFATEGSNFDYLMTNYLYKNTFLVRINVGSFQVNKYFSYLSEILYNAKPSYTQPVYVWRLDMGKDVLPPLTEINFYTSQAAGNAVRTINSSAINASSIN